MSMAAAAAPYLTWMNGSAAQAEETANQARAAAVAYETAFAATVPPPVIAANRSLLMTLISTNFLGQNTPAIAATETHYMEMWAQDAAAMYGYAGSSATATQLTPFTQPPQTTNLTGAAMQPAAVCQAGSGSGSNIGTQLSQWINSLPSALQNLASGATSTTTSTSTSSGLVTGLGNLDTILTTLNGPYSLLGVTNPPGAAYLTSMLGFNFAQTGDGVSAYLAGPTPISGALAPLATEVSAVQPVLSPAGFGGAPVSAAMGKASLVGSMSVPQNWTEAAPAIRTLAATLPTNLAAAPAASFAGGGGAFSQMALSGLAGRAVAAAATRSAGSAAVGGLGGVVAAADPAAATIIVIPAVEG
jgi:PPE-repeat protein